MQNIEQLPTHAAPKSGPFAGVKLPIAHHVKTATGKDVYRLQLPSNFHADPTKNGGSDIAYITKMGNEVSLFYVLEVSPYEGATIDHSQEQINEYMRTLIAGTMDYYANVSRQAAEAYMEQVLTLLINVTAKQFLTGNIQTWEKVKEVYDEGLAWKTFNMLDVNIQHQLESLQGALDIVDENIAIATDKLGKV